MRTRPAANYALLKLFMNKANFDRWYHLLNKEILSDELRQLLSDFYLYYRDNDITDLPVNEFLTWFGQIRHKKLEKVDYDLFEEMITKAADYKLKNPDNVIKHFHLKELQEKLLEEVHKDVFSEKKVNNILSEYDNKITQTDYEQLFCRKNIQELFEDTDPLYQYKLSCLNNGIGGIYNTDYIMIAAPIHTGKSAFLIDMSLHIAKQTDKIIYYMVNEESREQVKQKLVKAALLQYKRSKEQTNYSVSYEKNFYKLSNFKKESLYNKIVGGEYKIEVVDISGMTLTAFSALVKKLLNPGLLVIDLVSKLGTSSDSEHQMMVKRSEAIKDLTKALNVPIIGAFQGAPGTSWLDNSTGETKVKKWIHMSDIAGAKNAAGPVDVFIGIGQEEGYRNYRSIYVSKNRNTGKVVKKDNIRFIGEECNYIDD